MELVITQSSASLAEIGRTRGPDDVDPRRVGSWQGNSQRTGLAGRRFAAVFRPLRLNVSSRADNIQELDMTATDQTFVEAPTVADGIILTDGAAGKVKALLEGEGRDDLALRVAVQPGAAPVCATSSSSTSATSRATS